MSWRTDDEPDSSCGNDHAGMSTDDPALEELERGWYCKDCGVRVFDQRGSAVLEDND